MVLNYSSFKPLLLLTIQEKQKKLVVKKLWTKIWLKSKHYPPYQKKCLTQRVVHNHFLNLLSDVTIFWITGNTSPISKLYPHQSNTNWVQNTFIRFSVSTWYDHRCHHNTTFNHNIRHPNCHCLSGELDYISRYTIAKNRYSRSRNFHPSHTESRPMICVSNCCSNSLYYSRFRNASTQ